LADALATPGGAALIDDVRGRGLHLELCPTSNVHTGAAASIAAHPIGALHRVGLSVSFHTDNALMSRVILSQEAAGLLREGGVTRAELIAMELEAARHSFLDQDARSRAEAAIRAFAKSSDQNAALN
jgi:adenosine deaminase